MNKFDFFNEKAEAMRAIGNFESAKEYEDMANEISNQQFDGLVQQLGFGVKRVGGVALLVDDCGNEREATMTERVLWDALVSAQAEFSCSN